MSKYSTIMNKKRVDLLVYLHMYFRIRIYNLEQKEGQGAHRESFTQSS